MAGTCCLLAAIALQVFHRVDRDDVFVDVDFWLLVHDVLLGLMVCWLETPNSSDPLAVQPTVAKVCAAKFSAKGVAVRAAELSLFATNDHYPRTDTRRSDDAR